MDGLTKKILGQLAVKWGKQIYSLIKTYKNNLLIIQDMKLIENDALVAAFDVVFPQGVNTAGWVLLKTDDAPGFVVIPPCGVSIDDSAMDVVLVKAITESIKIGLKQ